MNWVTLGKQLDLCVPHLCHLQGGAVQVGLQCGHLGSCMVCTSSRGTWHAGVPLLISETLLSSEDQLSFLFVGP